MPDTHAPNALDTLTALQCAPADPADVMAFFDSLPPVANAAMLGQFRGEGVATGHPMDGSLERFGWYGKAFVDEESVHPLLFHAGAGRVRPLNPGWMPMRTGLRFPQLNNGTTAAVFKLFRPLLGTGVPRARLRQVTYRGTQTAAMVYDQLAIIDVFRAVDDDTRLGVMDMKDMDAPFFFVLRRDPNGPLLAS